MQNILRLHLNKFQKLLKQASKLCIFLLIFIFFDLIFITYFYPNFQARKIDFIRTIT